VVLQDEIYGDMVFGSNVFFPIATLTKTVPVVAVGGLAKQFLIPGWRVGWVMVHDRNNVLKDVRTAYFKLSQNILGANSLVQVREISSPCHHRTAAFHSLATYLTCPHG
jgi:tyrosine aminotransferase